MCFKLWLFRVLVLFIRLAGKLFSALSFVLVLELHQVSTVCQKKKGAILKPFQCCKGLYHYPFLVGFKCIQLKEHTYGQ